MSTTKRAILAGILGASVPATAMFCLSIAAFLPVLETLFFLGAIATSWGLSAGILTIRLQHQHARIVAFLMGFLGFVVGAIVGSYLYELDYARFLSQLSRTQLMLVYLVSVLGAGLLAQLLVLCLLLVLRWLTRRSSRGNNSLRK